jgi:hypothetical protein
VDDSAIERTAGQNTNSSCEGMLRRSGADSSEVGDYDEGCAAIAGAVRGTRNGEGGRMNFAFHSLTKKGGVGIGNP